MIDATTIERGTYHILNGETAHGLTIIQHDDEPPQATPTYLLSLNVGWADHVIAERMYLNDARGIGYILAAALDCPLGDVPDICPGTPPVSDEQEKPDA